MGEQRDYLETVAQSAEALLLIVNDILDFSKIEAGKMVLETQPANLRECAESALDLLAAMRLAEDRDRIAGARPCGKILSVAW